MRDEPDQHKGLLMARPCDQCLMTPKRIVSKRRAQEILRETRRLDCHFICHKAQIAGKTAACRGHFDATGGGQLYRILGRLDGIVEIDPDTMEAPDA